MAGSTKSAVGALVRPFGYELMKRSHWSLGDRTSADELARHLRKLFKALDVDCVLDVGANKGQYYEFLRERVEFQGRILSFEPIPDHAQVLMGRSRGDSRWRVFDCALGSTAGTFPIHVMNRSGWSSLLPKAATADTTFAEGVVVERVVDVPVRTMDDVLEEQGIAQTGERIYMKLDAQGFDLEVLKGAARSLPRIRALQSELELMPVYEGAPDYMTVLGYLRERQFQITGMFPVWRDDLLRVGELDTVFRNMRAA